MAKEINWDELEGQYGGPKYVKEGTYVVKLDKVEFHVVGQNGSIAQDFIFKADDKGAYPKARHWLSFKNDNWRMWHQRQLLVALGVLEDSAKSIVARCESNESKEEITKAYQEEYDKVVPKAIDLEIEVFADGRYMNADITNRDVRMNYPEKPEDKPENPFADDPLDGAEEATEIKSDDLPF